MIKDDEVVMEEALKRINDLVGRIFTASTRMRALRKALTACVTAKLSDSDRVSTYVGCGICRREVAVCTREAQLSSPARPACPGGLGRVLLENTPVCDECGDSATKRSGQGTFCDDHAPAETPEIDPPLSPTSCSCGWPMPVLHQSSRSMRPISFRCGRCATAWRAEFNDGDVRFEKESE
jgi:hypothetical protein